jgi:two-component system NtrC family response regulator
MRVLLAGVPAGLEAQIASALPSYLKVEFTVMAALEDADTGDWAAGCDAILIDSETIPDATRGPIVRGILGRIRERDPRARVLVLVPDEDPDGARAAAAAGAWEVLSPEAGAETCAERLCAAAAMRRLEREGARPNGPVLKPNGPVLAARQAESSENLNRLVGNSPQIRSIVAMIRRVAVSDVPVLITGESGTGKELAALSIHELSPRAKGPFVPINCAAVPESLLESELFGREKGAFTGATTAQRGRFETAHGGTLFLDEIGDLSPPVQVKILRFLEDHVVEHVGGLRRIPLDVRVIAATNHDLRGAVADGSFREDLFYRLNVFSLHLPPLRERGGDAALLADLFLEGYAAEAGRAFEGFDDDALQAILRAAWPGNVRELINRVRRAVVVAEGSRVSLADLDLDQACARQPTTFLLRDARHSAEIQCLRAALEHTGWNKSEAARTLGISRTQLYELMRRHGLPERAAREAAPQR